jgi:hypothetical protein
MVYLVSIRIIFSHNNCIPSFGSINEQHSVDSWMIKGYDRHMTFDTFVYDREFAKVIPYSELYNTDPE